MEDDDASAAGDEAASSDVGDDDVSETMTEGGVDEEEFAIGALLSSRGAADY